MKKMMTTLGVILSIGFLGCGGYSQKAVTSQGEESVQPQSTASQEEQESIQGSVQSIQATQVALKVEGMTCGGCEIGVRQCLVKLDGVKDAKVSYEKGEVLVSYNPEEVTKEKMVEEINKIGFKASLQ